MKIIGITGKAGSGKDTLAGFLVEDHGFHRVSFADPIRRAVADFTGIPFSELVAGPRKEKNLGWVDSSPRVLMQTLGTEWGRQMVDPDFWLKVARRRIEQLRLDGVPGVVIPDVRFDNEARFVRALGGRVVEVLRPTAVPVSAHVSEQGVALPLIQRWVGNDGSLERLRDHARWLVE